MTRRLRHRFPSVALASLAVAATLVVSGCAGEPGPRAVTTEESQLLAITRFANFDAGTRSISATFTDRGQNLALDGWFDYRAGVGYAALLHEREPNSLLTWQTHTLAVHPPAVGEIPLPPPNIDGAVGDAWARGPIDPTASTLHTILVLVSELGRDRPDNPLLLQQGRATWIATDEIDGVNVTIFGGPTGLDADNADSRAADDEASTPQSRLRYWLAEDGTMMRLEVLLGQEWVTINLGPGNGVLLDYDVEGAP